jgi:hypothetical protein
MGLGVLVGAPVNADTRSVPSYGPGFVASASHGHPETERRDLVMHTIRFSEDVEPHGDPGFGTLSIRLEPKGRRSVYVRERDGFLSGSIYNGRNRLIGFARVRRPDRRTLSIEIPRTALRNSSYRWRLIWWGPVEDCPDGSICEPIEDRVPAPPGRIRHRL